MQMSLFLHKQMVVEQVEFITVHCIQVCIRYIRFDLYQLSCAYRQVLYTDIELACFEK